MSLKLLNYAQLKSDLVGESARTSTAIECSVRRNDPFCPGGKA